MVSRRIRSPRIYNGRLVAGAEEEEEEIAEDETFEGSKHGALCERRESLRERYDLYRFFLKVEIIWIEFLFSYINTRDLSFGEK